MDRFINAAKIYILFNFEIEFFEVEKAVKNKPRQRTGRGYFFIGKIKKIWVIYK
jgi:hypothetical protein